MNEIAYFIVYNHQEGDVTLHCKYGRLGCATCRTKSFGRLALSLSRCVVSRRDTNFNFLDQGIRSTAKHQLQERQLTAPENGTAACNKTIMRHELHPNLEVDDAGSAYILQLSGSCCLPRTW